MRAAYPKVKDRRPAATALLYVLFATVSMASNLSVQEGVLRASSSLTLAVLTGTAAGFAVKYVLDKRFIFQDNFTTGVTEVRKISLYGFFSIFTTLIFWGFEIAFLWIFGTTTAKYTGAVIGLSIGYALKYVLDRTFVFRDESAGLSLAGERVR